MKPTIIATDRKHLKKLIKEEIKSHGNQCDLNHLDVSNVQNMSYIFHSSEFNGDISNWDVGKVKSMYSMFHQSNFNGDISKWNVSNVKDMKQMFYGSLFNGDISKWNVTNVKSMRFIFAISNFNGDVTAWKPVKLDDSTFMFHLCSAIHPYWSIENKEERVKAIESYSLAQELQEKLSHKQQYTKKVKI